MAEIKIEKKAPIWPWILLVILIIAIIVYFVYNNDKNGNVIYDNEMNNETIDTISNTYNEGLGTIAPYLGSNSVVQQFENSVTDSTRIGVDSMYTKTAIVNLARVVAIKADELDLQPSMALENLKYYSDPSYVTTDTDIPVDKDIYSNFKTVSKDIVTVLKSIQTNKYPSLEDDVLELKQTSSKIDTNMATKAQQITVQTFFSKAKKVVNDMNS